MGIKLHTMTYLQRAYIHLATVLPAFFLGAYLLFSLLVLYCVPAAVVAARLVRRNPGRGDHRPRRGSG